MYIEPSPVPHTKLTKINEMHEKGDRGGGMGECQPNIAEMVRSGVDV